MAAPTIKRFEHVVLEQKTGVFKDGALEFSDEVVPGSSLYTTFTGMTVGGRRIAAFLVEEPLPPSQRTAIVAAKPEWLDAIVFAEISAESSRERAVIDAETDGAAHADLASCAFAAAVVAESHGAFKIVPKSYFVRLGGESVEVTMDFDWDSESWRGEAAVG